MSLIRSTSALSAILAGIIVISSPSGQSNIVFTNGAASHVTSGYSAQIESTIAGPGEHVAVTGAGMNSTQSNGGTATITVVTK